VGFPRVRRTAAAIVVVCVWALAAPVVSHAAPETVRGGELSGARVVALLKQHPSLKLVDLVVTDELVLQRLGKPYELSADNVKFRADVDIAVDAKQSFSARTSEFGGVAAVVGPSSCKGCAYQFFADRSTFSSGVVVSGGAATVDLVRSTIDGPSGLRSFESFACRLCTMNANFVLAAEGSADIWILNSAGTGGITFEPGRVKSFRFEGSHLEQPIDLESASLDSLTLRCSASQSVLIRWEQFGDRWIDSELKAGAADERATAQRLRREALCWKHQFEANGRNADALTANYAAISLNRDYVLKRGGIDWLAAWMLTWPTSYGTAPWRLLLYSVVIIGVCWIFFLVADPFDEKEEGKARPKRPHALFALLFSVETFVPVLQVTGIKDWGWTIIGWRRWVEATEGLLGGVLTLLAAYSLASYVF
jgi:hypothetical protein